MTSIDPAGRTRAAATRLRRLVVGSGAEAGWTRPALLVLLVVSGAIYGTVFADAIGLRFP